MCIERHQGRSAAAQPAEMQHCSCHSPGWSNQSGPADMLTVLTQNMQRLSNLQFSSSSFQPCFRFLSNFLVHTRRVLVTQSDVVWIFMQIFTMNILIKLHVNIYNKYFWSNRDIYFTNKNIQKDVYVLEYILLNCNLNIINIY